MKVKILIVTVFVLLFTGCLSTMELYDMNGEQVGYAIQTETPIQQLVDRALGEGGGGFSLTNIVTAAAVALFGSGGLVAYAKGQTHKKERINNSIAIEEYKKNNPEARAEFSKIFKEIKADTPEATKFYEETVKNKRVNNPT